MAIQSTKCADAREALGKAITASQDAADEVQKKKGVVGDREVDLGTARGAVEDASREDGKALRAIDEAQQAVNNAPDNWTRGQREEDLQKARAAQGETAAELRRLKRSPVTRIAR